MITENKEKKITDEGLISPEKANESLKKPSKKISVGKNSKIVFMGDTRQNDINKKYVAVDKFNEIIEPINGCATFKFDRKDIVREQILIDIIDRFEQFEDKGDMPSTIRNAE